MLSFWQTKHLRPFEISRARFSKRGSSKTSPGSTPKETTGIKIKNTAKKKIFSLLEEEGMGRDAYVKVGVSSGGCSGLSYKLDFTKDKSEGDKLIEDNGVRILIDKKSLLYLVGTVLDFSGGLNGKGFTFNNPNASRTCGCGESFAV